MGKQYRNCCDWGNRRGDGGFSLFMCVLMALYLFLMAEGQTNCHLGGLGPCSCCSISFVVSRVASFFLTICWADLTTCAKSSLFSTVQLEYHRAQRQRILSMVLQELRGKFCLLEVPQAEESLLCFLHKVGGVEGPCQSFSDVDFPEIDCLPHVPPPRHWCGEVCVVFLVPLKSTVISLVLVVCRTRLLPERQHSTRCSNSSL